jgi:hypothetical protein
MKQIVNSTKAKSIHLGVFFLFLSLCVLGQLEKIQITSSISLYLHDIVLTAWLGASIFFEKKFVEYLREFWLRRTRLEVVCFVWIFVGIGGDFSQHAPVLVAIFYLLRLAVYVNSAILQAFLLSTKKISPKIFAWGYLGVGFAYLYFGFLQYFFMPDLRWLFFLGWDDHYYRLTSTILDPGFTGVLLVMSFFFLQSQKKQSRIHPAVFYLVSFAFLAGILLTYSRSAYGSLVIGLALAAFFEICKKNWQFLRTIVLFGFIFALCIPFLPHPGGEGVNLERTSTVYARENALKEVVGQMSFTEILIGRGVFVPQKFFVQAYDQPNHANIPDSWPIFFLSGSGLVGLGMFLCLAVKCVDKLFHQNIWLGCIAVVILAHGLFSATIVYPFVLLLFFGIFNSLASIDGR